MSKKQFNIETRLTADIDNLTSKLNTANRRVEHFKNQSKKGNTDLFKGIGSSLSGILPAIGLAGAALTTFQGTINTTQTAGDSWAVTQASMKGALDGFYRTLGTGDWDNLLINMVNSSEAAKELTKALDELFERGLSSNLKNSVIDIQLAEANKALKIAKAKGDSTEVLRLATEINTLEDTKLSNSLDVATKTKEAFFNDIKKITGLKDDELLKFIETYSSVESTKIREMAEKYNELYNGIEKSRRRLLLAGVEASQVDNVIGKEKQLLSKSYDNNVVVYAATLRAYNRLNDEKIQSAINAEITINKLKSQRISSTDKVDVAGIKSGEKINKQEEVIGIIETLQEEEKELRNQQKSANAERLKEINQEIELLNKQLNFYQNLGLKNRNPGAVVEKINNPVSDYSVEVPDKLSLISTDDINNNTENIKNNTDELSNYFSQVGDGFSSLGSVMSQFGDQGAAGIFSMIDGFMQLMVVMKTMGALNKTETAASLSQSAAKTSANATEGISGAVASGAGVGFPYNIVAIAVGVAAVIGALSNMMKFENGGIVGGNSFVGDKILARVNSGELILNGNQQHSLYNMMNDGNSGGQVEFEIRGDKLYGVLNNYTKKIKSYR